jgi:diacylglycerol O-acyltransferase
MSADRLTALDHSFLLLESNHTPMHVGAVLVLDGERLRDAEGRFRLDDVRQHLSDRLHLVPRLRQVVREVPFDLARPVWVDDEDFDLEHHVRLTTLPAPGDEAALIRLVEELMMGVLDRSRPLWEWWFVDGLPDGRVALVEKLHHALIDGVSGVQLTAALTDLGDLMEPTPGPWTPRPAPSTAMLVVDALDELAREPVRILRSIAGLVGGGLGEVRRRSATLATITRRGTVAPPTSLNVPIGTHRTLVPVRVSLSQVKEVAHAHDAKVNDVLLTMVAGGVRALLAERGDELSDRPLHIAVPENVRTDAEHLALGNRVSGFLASFSPDDAMSPVECLHHLRDEMRARRAEHQDEGVSRLLSGLDHLPVALARLTVPLVHQQPFANMVVTNVPGPREQLTLMGAPIEEILPIVPLAGNLSAGVAVLSYQDQLVLTIHADADACPDATVMAHGMAATLDALWAESLSVQVPAGQRSRSTSRRRASSTRLIS